MTNKNLKFITFTAIILIILLLPVLDIAINNSNSYSISASVLTTFLLLLFLYSIYNIVRNISQSFANIIVIMLFLMFAAIRVILSFVYDFSGRGFSSEFFAHFSWESFKIGLNEYGIVFFIAIITLLVFAILLFRYLNRLNKISLFKSFSLLIFTLIFLSLLRFQVPEYRLLTAYNHYFAQAENLQMDKNTARVHAKDVLSILRNSDKLPVEKNQLVAEAPENPKNIIIIYLESFSDILTNNDKYPNLTPNIDRLKKENISFENNFSSAYVTIEGIANSQCGTLMNMDSGNNSLTTQAGRLPNLPCLGDILATAGYKQIFYGGADLAFAGKGAFLEEHGYHELKGKFYWKEKGIGELNQWGLTDVDLFNQALKKIKELNKKQQPFNLTMLTLGTHIPGFLYRGCTPYNDAKVKDKFLDAIHCTDFLLGHFIKQLEENNLLQNTVVFIQGDHSIFPTHDMKQLFADKTEDRRVLNIIIDKTKTEKKKTNNTVDEKIPTSSMNLVANALDLLEINHNVDFILAESDFDKNKPNKDHYLITRYDDYWNLEKVYNLSSHATCDKNIKLTIPFDYCEKQLALTAIYQLDASYQQQTFDQNVCTLNAHLAINPKIQKLEVTWGDFSASNAFYSQGRILKNIKNGLYLLKLDKNDNVFSQQFYQANNPNELRSLIKYIQSKDARFVLLSNLFRRPNQHKQLIDQLPQSLFVNNFYYGHQHNGKLESLLKENYKLGELTFKPASCQKGFKLIAYKKPNNKDFNPFCKIKRWGPKKTLLGESFNKQPSRLSAYWLETDCAPKDSVMRVNGIKLRTVKKPPIITAAIDDKILLKQAKTYSIDLYSPSLDLSQKVGDFIVLANDNKPLKIKKSINKNKNLDLPPLIAHAAGGYKKNSYLNSLDALNYNYNLGHRFFEMDFNWTKDHKLVVIHDWKDTYKSLFPEANETIPTEKEFMQLTMSQNQKQLNLQKLDNWLQKHPDAYIVTDIRGNNVKALIQMKKVMKTAPNQIIPQLYHPTNYDEISHLGYNNIIFTLYATHLPTENLIEFIKKTPLTAITINPTKSDFHEILNTFKDSNKFVYVHTINTSVEMKFFLEQGVDGVYTDFLYLKNGIFTHQ